MSRPNARASTSPSTPSALTTCKSSPGGAISEKGSRPQLRFGHIPGNALTVEGLQRKLEPLSFCFGHPRKDLPKLLQAVEDGGNNQRGERHETRRRMLLRQGALRGRGRTDDGGAVPLPRMPIYLGRRAEHVRGDAGQRIQIHGKPAQAVLPQRPRARGDARILPRM